MRLKKTIMLLLATLILLISGCSADTDNKESGLETKGKIGFVPFSTGVPYFEVAAKGAMEKGKELGYEVIYKGPSSADSTEQIRIIDNMVNTEEVDALVVACMDSSSIVPSLKRAREKGIKVITWDLDSEKEGRDYYAGLMDLTEMGKEWIDSMVRTIGEEGQYAIITATLTNEFMAKRVDVMKQYAQEKYPKLELVAVESCDADPQKAYQISKDLLTKYPDIKCLATSATEAFSSGAKAIEDEGKIGEVFVVGGITPELAKPAFESGAAKESVLWDPGKWAGFAVTVAAKTLEGETFDKEGKIDLEGYPKAEVVGDDTLYYHEILIFTPENVDEYNF